MHIKYVKQMTKRHLSKSQKTVIIKHNESEKKTGYYLYELLAAKTNKYVQVSKGIRKLRRIRS